MVSSGVVVEAEPGNQFTPIKCSPRTSKTLGELFLFPSGLIMAFSPYYTKHLNQIIKSNPSGSSFRTLRKALGKTGTSLGRILGVDNGTISHWESETNPVNRTAWRMMVLLVKEKMRDSNEILFTLERLVK